MSIFGTKIKFDFKTVTINMWARLCLCVCGRVCACVSGVVCEWGRVCVCVCVCECECECVYVCRFSNA